MASKHRKLKIGVTCYPTFGGSGVIATEVGMAMSEKGHRVHFICYDVPRRLNRFTENVYFHEVEIHNRAPFISPAYTLSLASKMVDVALHQHLDVFHVHYAIPHAASAYLAKQIIGAKAPKIITTLHGTDITLVGNERSYLPIARFSIMESDGVTTPSQFLKHATYDKLNVQTSFPIEVIPNFVDTQKFTPPQRKESCHFREFVGACQDEPVLVHVSNFRAVKKVDDVVRIFALVNQKIPSRLVLVGDGPERSGVEELARQLGIEDRVQFLGKQDSTVEILQSADLFIFPSKNESFGLAALEAMACGLPVIGSNAEGIPELVVSGETGFLSSVGNVEEMAQNALRLLSDRELLTKFSKAARSVVETKFTRDQMTTKYEEYYYKVLGLH